MHPFAARHADSVATLGENRLIAAIRSWLGSANPPSPAGIGDDCAVVAMPVARALVTVDPVVFGRHFDATISPREVGAKLLKRNLSDIAAMGGTPRVAVVSLLLDPRTKTRWLAEFYRGIAAAARTYRVKIVGGDVAEAPNTVAATLTMIGAAGRRTLTRSGARIGDWIYVTGQLGNSLATRHHVTFRPRLAEGQWLAGRREVRCLIDVSDGLAKDLRSLAPDDGYPAISAAALPLRTGADVRAALEDGEDYELLFALARRSDRARFEAEWKRRFPRVRLSLLGRFVRSEHRRLRSSGAALPADVIDLHAYHGYEHLR
jgi:thiamine-monophosphate kinase